MTKRCAWCETLLSSVPKTPGNKRFCYDVCRLKWHEAQKEPAPPRQRHCFQCGADFTQEGIGRPRVTCGKAACARARTAWLRNSYLPKPTLVYHCGRCGEAGHNARRCSAKEAA